MITFLCLGATSCVLRAYSWLCTQRLPLVGLGDHMEFRGANLHAWQTPFLMYYFSGS